jgi:chemotaxis protein methyltransferase CheR
VLATAAAARPPRVWCAGCSTGEEAYTLAVLLEEAGPAQEAWQVLGTDINAEALRKAEIGSYRAWSFRGGAQRLQERHVVARPDGTFQVQPYLQSRVRFEYLNLAEEGYPALLTGTNAMDLILCRNVLMYFDGATIEATLGRLRRCLVDGGWLVVSPVEVPLVQASPEGRQLTCVELGGLRAFRALPADSAASAPESGLSRKTATPRAGRLPAPARPHKQAAAAPTAPRARGRRSQVPAEDPQARPSGDPTPLEVARALADQGRLIEALALCDRAVEREPLNPELLYLQATVCEELGRPAEAATAHRSALFADPRFVLSHFALGALEHRSGRAVAARRHFRNAAALLAGRQEEEPVGGHEPITVGRLRELLDAILRQAAAR